MTRATAWRAGELHLQNLYSGRESTCAASAVVVVHQRRAADSLARDVERVLPRGVPVHVIGDALAPRRMTHAALEGARIGMVV